MQKMRSIKGRLMRLLLLAVAALVIVGSLGIAGMLRMNYDQKELQKVNSNNLLSARMVAVLLDLRIQLREALVNAGNDDAVEIAVGKMMNCDVQLEAIVGEFRQSLKHQESVDKFLEIEALHNYLMTVRPGYYELARAGDVEGMSVWLTTYVADALHFQALGEELSEIETAWALEIGERNDRTTLWLTTCSIVVLAVSVAVLLLSGLYIVATISGPIQKIAEAAETLAKGDVHVDVHSDSNDEIGILSRAFQEMARSIAAQAELLRAISHGDYTVTPTPRSDQDVIGKSLEHLVGNGQEIIADITEVSSMVYAGASQIAIAAQNLSNTSVQQQTGLQSFTRVLQGVLEGANTHAQVTESALDVTKRLKNMVEESNAAMSQMHSAMQSIRDSSQGVSNIIRVIEDIAFQTNILALNASVEAARAGHYGKGFAVVADEVRSLAAKSAQAAQETAGLIAGSVRRVEDGTAIVESTNAVIGQMKDYLDQSVSLFAEMADCPVHRKTTVETVRQEMQQILQMVESNMALAEEAASTSEELSSQAGALDELIKSHFHIRLGNAGASRPRELLLSTDSTQFAIS